MDRTAKVQRATSETEIDVELSIDGTGVQDLQTTIPFLDHMLHQISSHGLIDLDIKATGDLHIDDHHPNEDVGITLGMALAKALGDRKGIHRFGHFAGCRFYHAPGSVQLCRSDPSCFYRH